MPRLTDRHSSSETLRNSELGEEDGSPSPSASSAISPRRRRQSSTRGEEEYPPSSSSAFSASSSSLAVTQPCDRFLADSQLYGNYINIRAQAARSAMAAAAGGKPWSPLADANGSYRRRLRQDEEDYDNQVTGERMHGAEEEELDNDDSTSTLGAGSSSATTRRPLCRSLSESATKNIDLSEGLTAAGNDVDRQQPLQHQSGLPAATASPGGQHTASESMRSSVQAWLAEFGAAKTVSPTVFSGQGKFGGEVPIVYHHQQRASDPAAACYPSKYQQNNYVST